MRLFALMMLTFLAVCLFIIFGWDYIDEPEPLLYFEWEQGVPEAEPVSPPGEPEPEPIPTESGITNAVIIEDPEVPEPEVPEALILLPEIESDPAIELAPIQPPPPAEAVELAPPVEPKAVLPVFPAIIEKPKPAWRKPEIIIDLDWIRELKREDL